MPVVEGAKCLTCLVFRFGERRVNFKRGDRPIERCCAGAAGRGG